MSQLDDLCGNSTMIASDARVASIGRHGKPSNQPTPPTSQQVRL
jgi:hypothetical protein